MGVDEAGHDNLALRIDHDRVAGVDIRADLDDPRAVDQDIADGEVADGLVHRQHRPALDQDAAPGVAEALRHGAHDSVLGACASRGCKDRGRGSGGGGFHEIPPNGAGQIGSLRITKPAHRFLPWQNLRYLAVWGPCAILAVARPSCGGASIARAQVSTLG
jgi:hypothetical protein